MEINRPNTFFNTRWPKFLTAEILLFMSVCLIVLVLLTEDDYSSKTSIIFFCIAAIFFALAILRLFLLRKERKKVKKILEDFRKEKLQEYRAVGKHLKETLGDEVEVTEQMIFDEMKKIQNKENMINEDQPYYIDSDDDDEEEYNDNTSRFL